MTDSQKQLEKFYKLPAIDLVSDEIEQRFPHLAKLLYLFFRMGFRNIRNSILDDIAKFADQGDYDDFE